MTTPELNTLSTAQPYDVLAIGAHPDDVEMGMAGTVAQLTAAGHRVAILAMTRGEMGTHGDLETRTREARAAAEVLRCDVRLMNFPDGGLSDDLENRHAIVRVLRQCRPRLVFAPFPYARTGPMDGRSNVDHLSCGSLVLAACKLARFRQLMPELEPHAIQRLFYYMIPDTEPPSFVVDVSDQESTVRAAIEAYASQMPISRGERSAMDFLLLARSSIGARIGVQLGEGFITHDAMGGGAATLFDL